ncbi:hypothetical protein CEV08_03350 [Bartonella tribocorum]|uniref:Uncharacterized protein n=1 Tax=Bartonella tribocorum TaxID=85701 RepID=A0A2M6UWL3_9HYPH|nr:hypothetical protein CEV08_03350 [Bartonella tribocorum]
MFLKKRVNMQHKSISFKAFLHKNERKERKTMHNLCHLIGITLNGFKKSTAKLKRRWHDLLFFHLYTFIFFPNYAAFLF